MNLENPRLISKSFVKSLFLNFGIINMGFQFLFLSQINELGFR